MRELSREIKKHAAELGFVRVGITPVVPLEAETPKLLDWLTAGNNGKMAWLEREPEKRADPSLILPGALSMVVVAENYFTPHKHSSNRTQGKISRYAWGDDYHEVVREKLVKLLARINEVHPAANGKICVDTTPIMEKAWAVRAGIGWLGKHSNLITTDHGSWVFLGEIILDIELEYDTKTVADHCGTCTACIDACPTDAITQPYVVDSRRCISYATIELRDQTIPAEIASDLEGWLYGCDICQDVCPWNRFEKPSSEDRFEPRDGETSLDLDRVISMTHEEYVERFRRSPMKRAKLDGLKRNAAALKMPS